MTGNHPHPARDQIQAHLNDVRDDYLDPETDTAPHTRTTACPKCGRVPAAESNRRLSTARTARWVAEQQRDEIERRAIVAKEWADQWLAERERARQLAADLEADNATLVKRNDLLRADRAAAEAAANRAERERDEGRELARRLLARAEQAEAELTRALEPVGVVKAFVWRNSRFDSWEWRCRERGCRHFAVSDGLAAAHFGCRSLHLAATAAAYHVRTSHRTGAPS